MAYEFYVTIEGTKQGALKGESTREKHQDKLTGLSFHYAVSSPRDAASGMATGRRQHQPISFVKEWGAASPQLFSAVTTSESLKSVVFEFVKTDKNGEEYVYQTIRLTNALITSLEQYIDDVQTEGHDTAALEKVSMTFQRIEMENADGKTSAIDEGRGR